MINEKIKKRIEKLSQITMDRGASENEARFAAEKIVELQTRFLDQEEIILKSVGRGKRYEYTVNIRYDPNSLIETWPGHLITILAMKHGLRLVLGESPYGFDYGDYQYILYVTGMEKDIEFFRRTYWLFYFEIEQMIESYGHFGEEKLIGDFLTHIRKNIPKLPKKLGRTAKGSDNISKFIASHYSIAFQDGKL